MTTYLQTCAGCDQLYQEAYIIGNTAQILGKPERTGYAYRCRANGYTVGAGREIETWPHMWCPKTGQKERMK